MTQTPDPPELLYHIEHQVWARPHPEGWFEIGITALGVRLSGEIYMCRPKGVGVRVEQGRSIGVVELGKSIVSVKSPLSGEVMELNHRLQGEPELVHRFPYGEGWLVRIRPTALDREQAALITGAAVAPAMREHARLYRIEY